MVNGLALGVPAVVRLAPKREAVVDAATQITVAAAATPERINPLAFGGALRVRYPIEITLVAPNPDDYLSNLDVYTEWRELIRNLFRPPFAVPPIPGVPAAFDLDIEPGVFADRQAIADFYDYFTVRIVVTTAE